MFLKCSDNFLSNYALHAQQKLPHPKPLTLKIVCSQKRQLGKPVSDQSSLYPLKTPESHWFSGFFRGYKMETLAKNN